MCQRTRCRLPCGHPAVDHQADELASALARLVNLKTLFVAPGPGRPRAASRQKLRESGFIGNLETGFKQRAPKSVRSLRARGGEDKALGFTLAAVCAALIVGCGGGSGGDTGGGGGQSGASGAKSGQALSPASANGAKGNVTVCLPKDVSGAFHKTIDAYNKSQTAVKAKLSSSRSPRTSSATSSSSGCRPSRRSAT